MATKEIEKLNAFLTGLPEKIKHKKGWKIALLVVLASCIIRGLAVQFVWKTDKFLYGFLYPLFIFVISSIITLPLYILNRIYKERGEKPDEEGRLAKWRDRHSVLWGFLGFLSVAAGLFLLLFGTLILSDHLITHITGVRENCIITYSCYMFYLLLGMYFFVTCIWMVKKNGLFAAPWQNEKGFLCYLPKKAKKKVLLASFLIFLLGYAVFQGSYGCAYEDGVLISRMYIKKAYSWNDVNRIALREKHGTLEYIVYMNDGKKMHLLGDAGTSFLDETTYPDEESFILALTKRFAKMNIPFDVNWNKLKKQLTYDYWKEYLEELRQITDNP